MSGQPESKRRAVRGDFSTPIPCERCGGKAHLVRRRLTGDGDRPVVRETREYVCENCGHTMHDHVD